MLIRQVLCFALYFLAVVLLCFLSTGSLGPFLEVPSLLFVLGAGMISGIGRHGLPSLQGIHLKGLDKKFLASFGNGALIGAAVECLVGVITILSNLGDWALIGQGLAVSLIGLFYALSIFGCIYCLPTSPK